MRSEAGGRVSGLATLVNTDQEEFSVASTIVDDICPPTKWVGAAFVDTAGSVVEIDDTCSSGFVRVDGWDGAGTPSCCAYGIDCFKTVFQGLFHCVLHGVQIDFTVALDVNIGVECKLEGL